MEADRAPLVSVDRRTTLRWFTAMLASGPLAACGDGLNWPAPRPITGPGYGTDPDLLDPVVPWPLTLSQAELETAAALADLILPAEGDAPSASQVGVAAFLDEWVSAPYPAQQRDRALIVPGLAWLDRESRARGGGRRFAQADPAVQRAIVEDIAFRDRVKPGLEKPGEFFALMRGLTLGAYYTTPEGWEDIGYMGNQPTSGPYPGPTPEAMAHVRAAAASLGLEVR